MAERKWNTVKAQAMTEQPQPKRKRQRASPYGSMRDVARELYIEQGLTPAAIDELLLGRFPDATNRPARRTIESWVAEFRSEDGQAWTITPDTAEVAMLVLPVLQVVVEHSDGRVQTIGIETARWVVTIGRAAPDLDAWRIYLVARRYQLAFAAGESNLGLDVFLAYGPWRSEGDAQRYAAALVTGRAPSPGLWGMSTWPEVVKAVEACREDRDVRTEQTAGTSDIPG